MIKVPNEIHGLDSWCALNISVQTDNKFKVKLINYVIMCLCVPLMFCVIQIFVIQILVESSISSYKGFIVGYPKVLY